MKARNELSFSKSPNSTSMLKARPPSVITPISRYIEEQRALTLPVEYNTISGHIVDAAFKVHSRLGPGLLESVYERCLEYELLKKGLKVRRQVVVPVTYDTLEFEEGYRIDLLVEEKVVVELKALTKPTPVHTAQLLTYMKLAGHKLGLLLCFNTVRIKDGILRRALGS
jgi:GxxExxY protein